VINKESEMAANFETIRVQMAHVKALDAAQKAAKAFADRHMGGRDGGACGFSWVTVYDVRSNSKVGKALGEVGFRKAYGGGLQLWNKWWGGQSVDAGEAGAHEYAKVLKEELALEKVYGGSRLD
jgi:hypothetical protein